jgi:hypothetical protein
MITKEKLFSKMDRLLKEARVPINRVFSLGNHPILGEVVHRAS